MGRCGCAQPANASLSSGVANALAVTGTGAVASPYVLTPRVSALAGQTLQVLASGLYAGIPAKTSYVPSLFASTTNPALGSGGSFLQSGFYQVDGNRMQGHFDLVFGSSGPSAGTGNYTVSVPQTISAAVGVMVGSGLIYDASAATFRLIVLQVASSTSVLLCYDNTSGVVGAAAPWTWAAGDNLRAQFTHALA